jgi:hypothetical protein
MKQMENDILLLQELLNVNFPQSYVDVLNAQANADTCAGILGLPVSLDLSSAWGATEFLRVERPDLGNTFVVIKIMDSTALCLDLKSGNKDDAPVVEIDLEADTAPTGVSKSLQKYLSEPESKAALSNMTTKKEDGFRALMFGDLTDFVYRTLFSV